MLNTNELLSRPDITEWLHCHEGSADQVKTAASILSSQQDGHKALKQLLPALSEKVVRVFFSYKSKDREAAKAVVKILRKFSAGKLKITYQEDFTEEITGQSWRRKIKEEICNANWFILMLPDRSDDWDWCLYETGLFDRQLTSADRMICLHHPETLIPDPIADYNHVPATIPKVEAFLRMVYLEENPIPGLSAINKDAEDDIPDLAKQIVNAISPPEKKLFHRPFEPWVELKVENPLLLEDKDQLDGATVESVNVEALNIFDFSEKPRTWGELRSCIKESKGDSRWREELFHVVRKIAKKRKFHPIQSVFKTRNGQFYRPVLSAIDRIGQGGQIYSYHITFSEDVTAIDSTAMPDELSRLATLLRFAFRFRWEILQQFGENMITVEDIEHLDNAYRRLNKDWESRGMGEELSIIELFENSEKPRVLKMIIDWNREKNKEGTGNLDIAMVNKDTDKIHEILKRFLPINQEFLELVLDRFNRAVKN